MTPVTDRVRRHDDATARRAAGTLSRTGADGRRPAGAAVTSLVTVLTAVLAGCTDTPASGDDPVAPPASTTAAAVPGARAPAPDGGDVPAPSDALRGEVERIVDGDTLVVRVRGDRERVRLLRIDAPELARDGRPAVCLAEEAAGALDDVLPAGASVSLATDVERRDRFGRLLAHVWTSDGRWVNGLMLREGWATVLTVPPNTALDDEVLAAQRAARAAHAGLWAPGACADG